MIIFMASFRLGFLSPVLRRTVFFFVASVDYPHSLYLYCEHIFTEVFDFLKNTSLTGAPKALSFVVENSFCIGFCQGPKGFSSSGPLNFSHSFTKQ